LEGREEEIVPADVLELGDSAVDEI